MAVQLTPAQRELLECSPHDLDLDERIVSLLESRGIFTIEQLLRQRKEQLLAIPSLGAITLGTIMKRLAAHGFVETKSEGATYGK